MARHEKVAQEVSWSEVASRQHAATLVFGVDNALWFSANLFGALFAK